MEHAGIIVYLFEGKGDVRQHSVEKPQSAASQRIITECLSEEWQQSLEYQVFDQGSKHLGFIFKGRQARNHFAQFSQRIANQVIERLGFRETSETPFYLVSGISNGPLHRHIWQMGKTGNAADPLMELLANSDIIFEQQLLEHTGDMAFVSESNFRKIHLRSPDGQDYGAIVVPAVSYYLAENKRYIANQRGSVQPASAMPDTQTGEGCDISPPDQQIWSKSSEVIQEMWDKLDKHTTNQLQMAVSEEPGTPDLADSQDIPVVDANKGETTTRKFVQELLDTLNESEQPDVEIVTPPQRTKQFQKKKPTSDPLRPLRIETTPDQEYSEDNESGMGVILAAIVLGILALAILWFFSTSSIAAEGCSSTSPIPPAESAEFHTTQ